MTITRRDMVATTLAVSAIAAIPAIAKEAKPMFGLIGQMTATPGKRDELVGYLLEGSGGMPGCFSYIVALDTTNPDAIWITEVWDSKESHKASLGLPQVRAAIAKARPIIAGFGSHTETVPLGGTGLPRP
ncbi:MAG: antibiotic biosynthesis monooxygenase [Rhizorhabdus sp.]|nr:antibiotic biosynthesis monooxygenase [Rhizorhabdus sp.]